MKRSFDENALPDNLKAMLSYIKAVQLSELPQNPEANKWYRLSPDGLICANGTPYHACIKIGTEPNLAVIFGGGGASFDEYMAARPITIGATGENFYGEDTYLLADIIPPHGLGSAIPDNPFRNWSMLFISYASGDFHTGTNDFPYTDTDGDPAVCNHHGYTNYTAVMQRALPLLPKPDKLLITGFSAGGFGASLLCDDVMGYFPDCKNVTLYVDSALLINENYKHILTDVWKTPTHIAKNVHSDNLVSDCLINHHNKHKNLKILFSCSLRDGELSKFQAFIDRKEFNVTADDGIRFEQRLKDMCDRLTVNIPDIGLWLFVAPYQNIDDEKNLTMHCINMSDEIFKISVNGTTAIQWLWNAVNGKIEKKL